MPVVWRAWHTLEQRNADGGTDYVRKMLYVNVSQGGLLRRDGPQRLSDADAP